MEEEIFEKVLDLFEINTAQELKDLVEKEEIVYFMKYGKKRNLERIFKLKDLNKENFIKLSENEKVVKFITVAKERNLEIVWDLFEINTADYLINFVEIELIFEIIKTAKEGNFEIILNLKGVNKESFMKLIKKVEIVRFMENAEEENLAMMLDFLEVKQ